jgi:hypothetical protein
MTKITLSNEVKNNLKKEQYYTEDQYLSDVKTYIKAVKSGRIQYTVTHVSSSGMSRNISIKSFEGVMAKGYYRNYFVMLRVMGYKSADKYSHDIRVGGCGMSMTFSTNYNLIHSFYRMGFINKATCDVLAQRIN